jgi:serine protease Do
MKSIFGRARGRSWVLALVFSPLIVVALAVSCGSGSSDKKSVIPDNGSSTTSTATTASTTTSSSSTTLVPSTTGAAVAAPNSIASIVQKIRPAAVQITNEQTQFDRQNQSLDVPAGVGTGVIYDKSGLIITNNHVITGAQKLLVTLPDGRSFQAAVVGADPRTDIAVVKVQATDLPVASLGDSSKLQVGDLAIAVGNALDLTGGPTVTSGVISALERTAQEPDARGGSNGPELFGLIQTDAAINPGNSGGPLTNSAGEVIGINTLVAGEAEPGVQSQGIGFAININKAKEIADELVKSGSVQHAYLGVNYVPLTPAVAAQLGTQEKSGIAVAQVVSGSPAATAGIKSKDIITQVDGKDLKGESDLAQTIDQHKPGDSVTLTVVRGTDKSQMKVSLGKAPDTSA